MKAVHIHIIKSADIAACALPFWIKGRQCEIIVIISAPAPVDMKQPIGSVPVTDKCMTGTYYPQSFKGELGVEVVKSNAVGAGVFVTAGSIDWRRTVILEIINQRIRHRK